MTLVRRYIQDRWFPRPPSWRSARMRRWRAVCRCNPRCTPPPTSDGGLDQVEW